MAIDLFYRLMVNEKKSRKISSNTTKYIGRSIELRMQFKIESSDCLILVIFREVHYLYNT